MRQRLALERALLHRPRLVLLDEPFTGLDDRAVRIVAERLQRLAADGAIVVLATHDLDVADGLITRMAVVRNGRLLTDEAGERRHPSTVSRPGGVGVMFFRVALLVLKKDFAIELKSYEILSTTLFFAVSCVAIFSFAFVKEGRGGGGRRGRHPLDRHRVLRHAGAGTNLRARALWRNAKGPAAGSGAAAGDLSRQTARASWRCCSRPRSSLVPMVAFLFNAPFFARPLLLVALARAGHARLCGGRTLFAAMLVRARTRDVMLPILLYPITIPVIIAGVRGLRRCWRRRSTNRWRRCGSGC